MNLIQLTSKSIRWMAPRGYMCRMRFAKRTEIFNFRASSFELRASCRGVPTDDSVEGRRYCTSSKTAPLWKHRLESDANGNGLPNSVLRLSTPSLDSPNQTRTQFKGDSTAGRRNLGLYKEEVKA